MGSWMRYTQAGDTSSNEIICMPITQVYTVGSHVWKKLSVEGSRSSPRSSFRPVRTTRVEMPRKADSEDRYLPSDTRMHIRGVSVCSAQGVYMRAGLMGGV